ncbi:MAG: hydroxymyristoyl-ACP dehydratase [Burkholderiales bacterium]|nr:hydroxymyristoyl-ACP dehydratase [Burkholderiales bacterium]
MNASAPLDHAAIAALIPHAGTMCLLSRVEAWDERRIRCIATGHTGRDHPLRTATGLLAGAAIEYAAQAVAVHGGLRARTAGHAAAPGFLASARGVTLHRLRLDELAGELAIETEHLAGDDRQRLYAFTVRYGDDLVADGRLTVVLDTALPA